MQKFSLTFYNQKLEKEFSQQRQYQLALYYIKLYIFGFLSLLFYFIITLANKQDLKIFILLFMIFVLAATIMLKTYKRHFNKIHTLTLLIGCLIFIIQLKFNVLYLEHVDSDPEYTKSDISEIQMGFIIAMIMHIGMVGSTLWIVYFNVTSCFVVSYFFLPGEHMHTMIQIFCFSLAYIIVLFFKYTEQKELRKWYMESVQNSIKADVYNNIIKEVDISTITVKYNSKIESLEFEGSTKGENDNFDIKSQESMVNFVKKSIIIEHKKPNQTKNALSGVNTSNIQSQQNGNHNNNNGIMVNGAQSMFLSNQQKDQQNNSDKKESNLKSHLKIDTSQLKQSHIINSNYQQNLSVKNQQHNLFQISLFQKLYYVFKKDSIKSKYIKQQINGSLLQQNKKKPSNIVDSSSTQLEVGNFFQRLKKSIFSLNKRRRIKIQYMKCETFKCQQILENNVKQNLKVKTFFYDVNPFQQNTQMCLIFIKDITENSQQSKNSKKIEIQHNITYKCFQNVITNLMKNSEKFNSNAIELLRYKQHRILSATHTLQNAEFFCFQQCNQQIIRQKFKSKENNTFQLNLIFDHVIKQLTYKKKQKFLDIQVIYENIQNLAITNNVVKTQQLIHNLLRNALSYSQYGSKIIIKVQNSSINTVQISISNTITQKLCLNLDNLKQNLKNILCLQTEQQYFNYFLQQKQTIVQANNKDSFGGQNNNQENFIGSPNYIQNKIRLFQNSQAKQLNNPYSQQSTPKSLSQDKSLLLNISSQENEVGRNKKKSKLRLGLIVCMGIVGNIGPKNKIDFEINENNNQITFKTEIYNNINILNFGSSNSTSSSNNNQQGQNNIFNFNRNQSHTTRATSNNSNKEVSPPFKQIDKIKNINQLKIQQIKNNNNKNQDLISNNSQNNKKNQININIYDQSYNKQNKNQQKDTVIKRQSLQTDTVKENHFINDLYSCNQNSIVFNQQDLKKQQVQLKDSVNYYEYSPPDSSMRKRAQSEKKKDNLSSFGNKNKIYTQKNNTIEETNEELLEQEQAYYQQYSYNNSHNKFQEIQSLQNNNNKQQQYSSNIDTARGTLKSQNVLFNKNLNNNQDLKNIYIDFNSQSNSNRTNSIQNQELIKQEQMLQVQNNYQNDDLKSENIQLFDDFEVEIDTDMYLNQQKQIKSIQEVIQSQRDSDY